jgi:short-subunit dehydrogenase
VALQLDVTDRDSFSSFLDRAERELGPIDVLINNAGIMPLGRFAEEDDATARRMVDINLHGVILGTKLALERMEPRNRGHIVNIASQTGKSGLPGGATYSATKHAVVGLSEAVRAELFETEIEVSCVMPAIVNTELAAGLKEARGVKNLEPEQVADAIVNALESPRFDVWVPRSTQFIATAVSVVPRRGREAIGRLLKVDKVLAEADPAQRVAYEDRAAHSESGLEPEEVSAEQ